MNASSRANSVRVRLIEREPRSTSRVWVLSTRSLKDRLCADGSAESATVPGAADQRPQPGEQLVERERLGQVVVAAGVEPIHPVADRVAGGEHQNGDVVAGRAQHPGRLQAVEPRHHHVHDHRVGPNRGQPGQGLDAVLGRADLVRVVLQRAFQGVADRLIIVDDKDVHERKYPRSYPLDLRHASASVGQRERTDQTAA